MVPLGAALGDPSKQTSWKGGNDRETNFCFHMRKNFQQRELPKNGMDQHGEQ